MKVEWDEQSEVLIVTTKYSTFRIDAVLSENNGCFYCIPNQDFMYTWGNQRKEMSKLGFRVRKNNDILIVTIDCDVKYCRDGSMQVTFPT